MSGAVVLRTARSKLLHLMTPTLIAAAKDWASRPLVVDCTDALDVLVRRSGRYLVDVEPVLSDALFPPKHTCLS